MKNRILPVAAVLIGLGMSLCYVTEIQGARYRIAETIEVDKVPSWFPVGFCLLTHGDHQYAAYYNEKHQMIVARRELGKEDWQRVNLPSKVGWDSHNYITMTVDSEGHLHLSGNMHCVPLIYFRTEKPGDITTFKKMTMTGKRERRVTYPRFIHNADGNLLFMYRDGGSGNGSRLFNRYDVKTRTWSPLHSGPMFDGGGKMNAYPNGPVRREDGLFHVVWAWRDTPDCATNHDLSYARSRDMVNWESAGGKPVKLPITIKQTELCVDPIPAGGGLINGSSRLVFDSTGRPMISYHKRDTDGHMQIYVARFEEGKWLSRPITSWDKPVPFGGRGAMPFIGIKAGGLQKHPGGVMSLSYRHRDYGTGRIYIDENDLLPLKADTVKPKRSDADQYPKGLHKPNIDFEGIRVKTAQDSGKTDEPKVKYILRWETLDAHYDRPRQPPLPPASTLKLLKLERE